MTPPTPFDAYFAARIAPALAGAPPDAVKLARAAAVDIWNAALDAVDAAHPTFELDHLDGLRARVTP